MIVWKDLSHPISLPDQEMNPELGPLSRRVETTFLEGIYSEKVNLEETDYWFTEPEGLLCDSQPSEQIITYKQIPDIHTS